MNAESAAPLRVALLFDMDDWILGSIAREIESSLSGKNALTVYRAQAPHEAEKLDSIIRPADVVHFLSPWDFFRLGKVCTKPTAVTIHHMASKTVDVVARHAPMVDSVCTTNEQCAGMLEQMSVFRGRKIHRTPYGIDVDFFRPMPEGRRWLEEQLGLTPGLVLLGLAAKKTSNEEQRKGFDRYHALLRCLKAQGAGHVRLVVSGPPAGQPGSWTLNDFPEDVRGLVVLAGYIARERLPHFYSALDAYVCLSRLEGGPYPVMEAMACGTPVASTPVGIVPGLVVEGETGWEVDGEDASLRRLCALAMALQRGELTAMGEGARTAVVARFGFSTAYSPTAYRPLWEEAAARWRQRPLLDRALRHARVIRGRLPV